MNKKVSSTVKKVLSSAVHVVSIAAGLVFLCICIHQVVSPSSFLYAHPENPDDFNKERRQCVLEGNPEAAKEMVYDGSLPKGYALLVTEGVGVMGYYEVDGVVTKEGDVSFFFDTDGVYHCWDSIVYYSSKPFDVEYTILSSTTPND